MTLMTFELRAMRTALGDLATRLAGLRRDAAAMLSGPRVDADEVRENLALALRAVEDGRMRCGKVLQALDGGESIYDRSALAGPKEPAASVFVTTAVDLENDPLGCRTVETPTTSRVMVKRAEFLQAEIDEAIEASGIRGATSVIGVVQAMKRTIDGHFLSRILPRPDVAPRAPKLTMGRIVIYVLSSADAEAINRRRTDGQSIYDRMAAQRPEWPAGAQAHIGTRVEAGMAFAAMAVRIGTGPEGEDGHRVNLQVFLDGTDVYWAASVREGGAPGTWHWPVIA